MEKVYRLEYKKEFKDGEKTQHIKISKDKQKLFDWVVEFCKKQELTLEKSTNPDHEFLFLDGDWVYYESLIIAQLSFRVMKRNFFKLPITVAAIFSCGL